MVRRATGPPEFSVRVEVGQEYDFGWFRFSAETFDGALPGVPRLTFGVVDVTQIAVHNDVAQTPLARGLHLLDSGLVKQAESAFAEAYQAEPGAT